MQTITTKTLDSLETQAKPTRNRPVLLLILKFLKKGPVHVCLLLIGVVWLVPSLGLFISSLRTPADISKSGWWMSFFEWRYTLDNYRDILFSQGFDQYFLNTLMIAIPSTLIPLFIGAITAYALSWLTFPGRDTIFLTVVALLVVPIQVTWIPILKMFYNLGLGSSFIGIWLIHTAYGLPFAIFLLRNFFADLPSSLIEAARMDGASNWAIFVKIVVPLSTPALASLVIFQFVWVWNDLMNAIVFLQDAEKYPLTVGVQRLMGSYGSQWWVLAAGAFLTMTVPLAVFFSLQRYFVRGITAGGVKG